MITLTLHDDMYIALQADYAHRDDIKALAPYPEVRWHSEKRVWLVDARLLPKVINWFADVLAPLTLDFVFGYPIHAPKQARKTTRRNHRHTAQQADQLGMAQGAARNLIAYGRSRQ